MQKTALAIVVVLGLAALGVAAQMYLRRPRDTRSRSRIPIRREPLSGLMIACDSFS